MEVLVAAPKCPKASNQSGDGNSGPSRHLAPLCTPKAH
jgi:hypothetical protein